MSLYGDQMEKLLEMKALVYSNSQLTNLAEKNVEYFFLFTDSSGSLKWNLFQNRFLSPHCMRIVVCHSGDAHEHWAVGTDVSLKEQENWNYF